MKESILEDYKKNKKTYQDYSERIINLLNDLLFTENIDVHQLVGRTKSLESLSKKIDDKNGKYTSVEQITDIIGIRIITYLESHVNLIADLIVKEFVKDEINSIDKRNLQVNQFGYKSLHLVVSLNESRSQLSEYRIYKDLKCEIQIRSILQHAWAEIEHGLGYKGEISIPDKYKRSFNRVSALLETADIEFDRLKFELGKYEKGVKILIETKPDSVDINQTSVKSLLETNSILQLAKSLIEQKVTSPLKKSEYLSDSIFLGISFIKIKTIGALEKALSDEKELYLKFVKFLFDNYYDCSREYVESATLGYFLNFLILKTQDRSIAISYHDHVHFNTDLTYFTKPYQDFLSSLNN